MSFDSGWVGLSGGGQKEMKTMHLPEWLWPVAKIDANKGVVPAKRERPYLGRRGRASDVFTMPMTTTTTTQIGLSVHSKWAAKKQTGFPQRPARMPIPFSSNRYTHNNSDMVLWFENTALASGTGGGGGIFRENNKDDTRESARPFHSRLIWELVDEKQPL